MITQAKVDKVISKIYRKGEKILAKLLTLQQEQKKWKEEHVFICFDKKSLAKKKEYKTKIKLCNINVLLAKMSNKFGCYCEFYEEAL